MLPKNTKIEGRLPDENHTHFVAVERARVRVMLKVVVRGPVSEARISDSMFSECSLPTNKRASAYSAVNPASACLKYSKASQRCRSNRKNTEEVIEMYRGCTLQPHTKQDRRDSEEDGGSTYGVGCDLHVCKYVARIICSFAHGQRLDVKVLPFVYPQMCRQRRFERERSYRVRAVVVAPSRCTGAAAIVRAGAVI